jgi:hypothetical protein
MDGYDTGFLTSLFGLVCDTLLLDAMNWMKLTVLPASISQVIRGLSERRLRDFRSVAIGCG